MIRWRDFHLLQGLLDFSDNDTPKLSLDESIDADVIQQRLTVFSFLLYLGIIFLVCFALWRLYVGDTEQCTLNLVAAAVLIAVAGVIHFKGDYQLAANTSITVIGIRFIMLMAKSSADEAGHVWVLIYPLLAVFFLGNRKALPFVLGLLAVVLSLLSFHIISGEPLYSATFMVRFMGAYIMLSIAALTIDYIRERYQRSLMENNNQLSQMLREMRQVSDQLRISEAKHRSLVERAEIGIVLLEDGRIGFANNYIAKLLETTPEEMKNRSFFDFVAPVSVETTRRNYEARVAGRPAENGYEILLRASTGEKIEVEVNGSMTPGENGLIDLVLIRDVRQAKQAEREHSRMLRQQSALAMAVTASHELNQPLMVLKGNIDLLELKLPDTSRLEVGQKHIDAINSAIERIGEVLDGFHKAQSVQMAEYADDIDMMIFNDSLDTP